MTIPVVRSLRIVHTGLRHLDQTQCYVSRLPAIPPRARVFGPSCHIRCPGPRCPQTMPRRGGPGPMSARNVGLRPGRRRHLEQNALVLVTGGRPRRQRRTSLAPASRRATFLSSARLGNLTRFFKKTLGYGKASRKKDACRPHRGLVRIRSKDRRSKPARGPSAVESRTEVCYITAHQ